MNREIYIRMAEVENDPWWFAARRVIAESLLAASNFPVAGDQGAVAGVVPRAIATCAATAL